MCLLLLIQIERDPSLKQVLEEEAFCVKETLQEVNDWLVTDDDRQTKNRQKLLRNLRVCFRDKIQKYLSRKSLYLLLHLYR